MRIRVRHSTAYAYGAPARNALQVLRLTPRSHDGQFVRRWRVEIDADAQLTRSEDAFGNIAHTVFVEGPIETMEIRVEGEVDVHEAGGVVRGAVERLPEALFLRETPLTTLSPPIREFARDIAAGEGGDRLASLHRICATLCADMAFRVGATDAATTADQAFAQRAGVCQDFAHIFIAAAHALGAPARYVSGYYLRTDRIDQEAGHAWAEAYLGDLGWVGFDPTHGVCVSDRHVRLAIGSSYLDAAPIRGAQSGGRDELLSVAVDVEQGQLIVEG